MFKRSEDGLGVGGLGWLVAFMQKWIFLIRIQKSGNLNSVLKVCNNSTFLSLWLHQITRLTP